MNITCNCCGNQVLQTSKLPNRFFPLAECTECGHVQIFDVTPSAIGPDEIQKAFFGEAFAARGSWAMRLFESMNNSRSRRTIQTGPPARVLEVGPGSGSLMNHLAGAGYEVVGFDLSSAVAGAIGIRYGLNVFVGSADELVHAYSETPFDVIVMRHVVEHFASPKDELKKLLEVLKVGGELLVAVPNADSWHSSFSGWSGFEPYHFQYFSSRSLRQLLSSLGLAIQKASTYESITGWPNTIFRSAVRKTTPQMPATHHPGENAQRGRSFLELIRLMAGVAITPVRWLQSRLGRGEELIVVARRVSK